MTGRYEILDIVSQDADGIVFHAEDRQTGGDVALRRFFPFGAGGGGLEREEREAYEVALRRLMQVEHPALRTILDGGTDPVDGIPFLVTEWLDGFKLSDRLAERLLSPQSARALADAAIEASQVLSAALGEEAVWVETHPESIVLCQHEGENRVTFWISPLRWLGSAEDSRSLRPLLLMVEQVTGWSGRMIQEAAGDGLGSWLKALRQHADDWSLTEARQALHQGFEAAPAASASPPPAAAPAVPPARRAVPAPGTGVTRPVVAPPKAPWWPWVTIGLIFLLAAGLMITLGIRKSRSQAVAGADDPAPAQAPVAEAPPNPAPVPEPAPGDPAAAASARAAQLASELAEMGDAAVRPDGGFVYPEENAQLVELGTRLRGETGRKVTLTTRLREVRPSSSGKTIYLEFGSTREDNALCARYLTEHGDGGMSLEALERLVGKRIRITGTAVNDPSGRIALDLDGRGDIEQLDDE